MLHLSLFAGTFGVIFIAELPDKSLLASLVLGSRYRPLFVWLGVSLAFLVHVGIAVLAGGFLGLLPHSVVEAVVAALFAAGGLLLLRPEREPPAEAEPAPPVRGAGPLRVVSTSFAVVFVGEWGDITQIAIANLTARYHDPVTVGLGSALALITVAGLAIRLGSTLLARVPAVVVRRVAGTLLLSLAVLTLIQLLT